MEVQIGLIVLEFAVLISMTGADSLWHEWWTYEGISGPSFWGMINQEFSMCSKGKNQSPINITSNDLLFDPGLKHLEISGNKLTGMLMNTGNDLTFYVNETQSDVTIISLGPLSYRYRINQIKFHFGRTNKSGSEHLVNGNAFSGEIQILAYNHDLYKNFTKAERSPRGIAVIAIFMKVKENETHLELQQITPLLEKVKYNEESVPIKMLYVRSLIPSSKNFMTYEGSLTYPGCHETVTWIILNRPIFVGNHQIEAFRSLRIDGPDNPQAQMAENVRPVKPLNRRTVRTNINFEKTGCSMKKNMHYKDAFKDAKEGLQPGPIKSKDNHQCSIVIGAIYRLYSADFINEICSIFF